MIAPNTPEPEIIRDDHHNRADAVMIRRAIREGWPIPQDTKAKVVEKMAKMLDSDNPGQVLGAARTLVQADSVNVKREGLDQKDDHHADDSTVYHEHSISLEDKRARLTGIAANLGVAGMVGQPAQDPSGGRAQPALEPPKPRREKGRGTN